MKTGVENQRHSRPRKKVHVTDCVLQRVALHEHWSQFLEGIFRPHTSCSYCGSLILLQQASIISLWKNRWGSPSRRSASQFYGMILASDETVCATALSLGRYGRHRERMLWICSTKGQAKCVGFNMIQVVILMANYGFMQDLVEVEVGAPEIIWIPTTDSNNASK